VLVGNINMDLKDTVSKAGEINQLIRDVKRPVKIVSRRKRDRNAVEDLARRHLLLWLWSAVSVRWVVLVDAIGFCVRIFLA
jgi:hypothetical protein